MGAFASGYHGVDADCSRWMVWDIVIASIYATIKTMLDCPVVPTCATRGSAVIAYAPWLGPRNRGGFSIYMMTSSNGNIFHVTGLCAGNSPVTGEFPSHGPVTRSFDVFFDLRLNKRLSKQSRSWWFETPSCPLWRHCNDVTTTAHMGTARKLKDKETCSNYYYGNMFLKRF